jgi:ribonuclease HI
MAGDHRKEISKGFRLTTNNRMELMAVIAGLKALKKNHIPITVFSDSEYVVNAVTKKWLDNWIRTNFKGGKKNKDLWLEFYELSKQFNIQFRWIRGHSDNPFNNRCDELATEAADGHQLEVDQVYESENG